MTHHLRKISITVNEPETGQFFWLLLESQEDARQWETIAVANEACTSWDDAFDAGCVALYKMVPDERIGPRAPGEDENADPVG